MDVPRYQPFENKKLLQIVNRIQNDNQQFMPEKINSQHSRKE